MEGPCLTQDWLCKAGFWAGLVWFTLPFASRKRGKDWVPKMPSSGGVKNGYVRLFSCLRPTRGELMTLTKSSWACSPSQ